LLEGDHGGEALAEQALPGRNVRYRRNHQNVESDAHNQSGENSLKKIARRETGVRFLGGFWRGLETGDEIRDDL
jgi:hypothetical protein